MNKAAFACLQREHPVPRRVTVTLIELDSPPPGRFMAQVVQDTEPRVGAVKPLGELPLTIVPGPRELAEQRALAFIQRRLRAGDRLVAQAGFERWLSGADPGAALITTPVPVSVAAASAEVPPAVKALVRRFHPDAWKLLTPERQCRSVWRVGEYGDPRADVANPTQATLRALAPTLVGLLGANRHALLDFCIVVALARLRDPGAAEALRALAARSRHAPTRRVARDAWLQLLAPGARQAVLAGEEPDAAVQALLAAWPADAVGFQALVDDAHALAAWAPALQHLYEHALDDPAAHAQVLAAVRTAPIVPGVFQGLRHVYKTAEMRLDVPLLGALHARFENTPPCFQNRNDEGWAPVPVARGHRRLRLRDEMARPQPRVAFGSRTRRYLQRRGVRTLQRLAAIQHPEAPRLAVALLLGLDDAALPPARASWEGHHAHAAAGWWLVPALLLARHPGVRHSAKSLYWWSTTPLTCDAAPTQRLEGLPALWDAHPEALLALALNSRCALVQAVVARALQDHTAWLARQPSEALQALLQSPFLPTARLALACVRTRLSQEANTTAQLPWWLALLGSPLAEAREFAWMQLARNPAGFARHPELVVALLLSAHEQGRLQGLGMAMLAEPVALLTELQAALAAIDPDMPGLAEAVAGLEALLQSPDHATLQAALPQLPAEPVLLALQHPSPLVLRLAVSWLLAWPEALRWLPPEYLTALLASPDPLHVEAGLRLMAALSDEILLGQSELLVRWGLSPHARIRATVRPLLQRLAARDTGFAERIAQRLHEALFRGEPAEGVHDDALDWLLDVLQPWAPGRDPASVWRALRAQSRGAQRYGAWALVAFLAPEHFSLRQQATLVQHPDAAVRRWAMAALEASLPARPTPEQAVQLMPLADTRFDDGLAFAHRLFAEQLTDETLPVTLLIDWVDHPQPWMQALGRSRLVRRMGLSVNAAEASVCLMRLSQHPSPGVQLFVTQWLLEKAPHDDEPSALAARLRQLMPYLLTVLSQVHRGRVAKTRIIGFLRGCIEAPQTAEVVAELFARQVVTCSLTDKPQYIAGLRDIQLRHPHISLPFVRWHAHAAATPAPSP